MKKHGEITAFYIETLLLITVFIAMLLVLTRIFGLSRAQSSEAKLLTNAVCLAENAAEAVSASGSEQELLALLDEGGNASREGGLIQARYTRDMTPDAAGPLRMDVTWEPTPARGGTMVSSRITVRYGEGAEPVYELETAVFIKEAGA